eukprot:5474460-Pyramimonas_sp.AAC.1
MIACTYPPSVLESTCWRRCPPGSRQKASCRSPRSCQRAPRSWRRANPCNQSGHPRPFLEGLLGPCARAPPPREDPRSRWRATWPG